MLALWFYPLWNWMLRGIVFADAEQKFTDKVRVKPAPRKLSSLKIGESSRAILLVDQSGSLWICPDFHEYHSGQKVTRTHGGWIAHLDDEYMNKEHEADTLWCLNPQRVEIATSERVK